MWMLPLFLQFNQTFDHDDDDDSCCEMTLPKDRGCLSMYIH